MDTHFTWSRQKLSIHVSILSPLSNHFLPHIRMLLFISFPSRPQPLLLFSSPNRQAEEIHALSGDGWNQGMPKPSFDVDHASPEDENMGEPTEAGQPHEALYLVLPYLSLSGLIAMGETCTSLRCAVRDDVLPWLELIVDDPLSQRMRDEILIEITSKANGKLRTLGLFNCKRITDGGLQCVVEKNPLIDKLYVPGCTGLTPEGVINAVKILSANGNNLRSIKINGIYNLQKQHLQVLRSYVQAKPKTPEHKCSTYFGREGDCNICPIDVEVCPKCNEVKKVVICPAETCVRKRDRRLSECRGCGSCIPRCIQCGACVELEDLEEAEAICADILCMSCWLRLPKCDFCNKPYCKQHMEGRLNPPGTRGFVCELCTLYEEDDIEIPSSGSMDLENALA